MQFVDIGINLTNAQFRQDYAEVVVRARNAGVTMLLLTGTNMSASHDVLALAAQLGERCFTTVGIHPHDASSWNTDTLLELTHLLAD